MKAKNSKNYTTSDENEHACLCYVLSLISMYCITIFVKRGLRCCCPCARSSSLFFISLALKMIVCKCRAISRKLNTNFVRCYLRNMRDTFVLYLFFILSFFGFTLCYLNSHFSVHSFLLFCSCFFIPFVH